MFSPDRVGLFAFNILLIADSDLIALEEDNYLIWGFCVNAYSSE